MRTPPRQTRARWARTNFANGGFKDNTPGGWIDTNGPVWWYGSDRAWLGGETKAGRAAITKAASLIVNRISSADWVVGADTPRWIADPMLVRPDDRYVAWWPAGMRVPRSVFWGQWIRSAVLWGMGYLVYLPDATDRPTAGTLGVLHPGQVSPDGGHRIISPQVGGQVSTDDYGEFVWQGRRFRMVELRNPTTPLDPYTGTTPGTLTHHAEELALLDAQLFYAEGTFSGAGVPSGFLKVESPNLTPQQAADLQQTWQSAHGSGQRRTAVLPSLVSYEPIAVSPVDAALADMRKLSLLDVANAFCVPSYLLGAQGPSMTYSNVGLELQALYEFTLLPWARAIEETLSALLPGTVALNIKAPGEQVTTSGNNDAGGPEQGAAGPVGDVPEG